MMNKKILIVISTLFINYSCTSKLECNDLQYKYFDLVNNLKTEKDKINFEDQINMLLNEDSKCVKAYQIRGDLRLGKNDYKGSKDDFMKAYLLSSSNVYSLYSLATLFNLEGNNDSALFYISNAIKSKSADGYFIDTNDHFSRKFDIPFNELLFFRAIVLYESGRFNLSKNDIFASLKYGHEKQEAYKYLIKINMNLEFKDSACYYSNKALKEGIHLQMDSTLNAICK